MLSNLLLCLSVVVSTAMAHEHHDPVLTKYGIYRFDCHKKLDGFSISGMKAYANDTECIVFTFSKLLGAAIILFAMTVKMPQIAKIFKNNSVKGINAVSYYTETISFAQSGAFAKHLGLGINFYGDTI
jgi:hypothetical protein